MKAKVPRSSYKSHYAAQTKVVEVDGIAVGTNQMEKSSNVPSQLGALG